MTQGKLFTGKKGFENGNATVMELTASATIDFNGTKVWKQARLEKQIDREIAVTFYIKDASNPTKTIPFTVRKSVTPGETFTYGISQSSNKETSLFVHDSTGKEVFRIDEGQTQKDCSAEIAHAAKKAKARNKRAKRFNS